MESGGCSDTFDIDYVAGLGRQEFEVGLATLASCLSNDLFTLLALC